MAVKTQRRRRNQMRGGSHALMPGSINDFNHGNLVQNQSAVGGQIGAMPNVSLAQSGGSRKKRRGSRRMYGGLVPLQPSELVEPAPQQKGGYFASVLKSALVPFTLIGLNQYAHTRSGKKPYMGKSRLSKRLRSRRNRH